MDAVKITLAGLWVALMLTYLLGDVLRIFSGDFKARRDRGCRTLLRSCGWELPYSW